MPFWDTVMASPSGIAYGRRLLPKVIDEIALKDPGRICFSYPRSSNSQSKYRDVTFRTFANAVNKTAHFIRMEIGISSMFETVMYMGHHDIRHFIILVALMKTGHKALFSSHRNSLAGHAELIKQSDCGIIMYTSGFSVNLILERCRMESLCMPELEYLLGDNTPCEDFPYEKTFEEAKNHPCMVIHTSGSTGLPKPVVWTHWTLAGVDIEHLIPPFDGRPTLWGNILLETSKRAFSALPIFHGAGLVSAITRACFGHTTIVIGPPGMATANTLAQLLDNANIDSAFCVPSPLEEAATRPDVLEKLAKLKYIVYTGGFLTKSAGDTISRIVPLYSVMASTEASIFAQYATDPEDWEYVHFDLEINGIEMRPYNNNLYELVIVKNPKQADHQGIFKNFPILERFAMADLYEKHSTKPGLWKYVGRSDDMIILKSGWNFHPAVHEQIIASHQAVRYCILVGTGKDIPAAIIELNDEYTIFNKQEIVSALAPAIDMANSYNDSAGQLRKNCLVFAKKEKPFAVAGKGTVQRKATIDLYKDEIEQLYESINQGALQF